jgi:hypothetical protein
MSSLVHGETDLVGKDFKNAISYNDQVGRRAREEKGERGKGEGKGQGGKEGKKGKEGKEEKEGKGKRRKSWKREDKD